MHQFLGSEVQSKGQSVTKLWVLGSTGGGDWRHTERDTVPGVVVSSLKTKLHLLKIF